MQIPKALAVRLIARLAIAYPIYPRSSRIPLVYVALVELEGFAGAAAGICVRNAFSREWNHNGTL